MPRQGEYDGETGEVVVNGDPKPVRSVNVEYRVPRWLKLMAFVVALLAGIPAATKALNWTMPANAASREDLQEVRDLARENRGDIQRVDEKLELLHKGQGQLLDEIRSLRSKP